MLKKMLYIIAGCAVIVVVTVCLLLNKNDVGAIRDFSEIKADSTLTALTLSESVSYFIYKGNPMGYEYELIKNFADAYRLQLKIKTADNESHLIELLNAGEGDVIAYTIPMTNQLKKQLIYCGHESVNEQVLIQRSAPKDALLTDVTDMIGKEIWVVKGSKYYQRLANLNHELGGGIIIKIIEKDTVPVEDLIEMVSTGAISYTISDKDIAQLNRTYFHNIDIRLQISHPQRSAWAVAKGASQLADTLNAWFGDNARSPRYKSILKRYFEMSKMPGDEPAPILSANAISVYDPLFKAAAKTLDWDWRLLASIAYQESKFDPESKSWAGAIGLMGLMPQTAEANELDTANLTDPEGNIKAATNYILKLKKIFPDSDDPEKKLRFVLASYNAGPGHVLDARALARKLGKDPETWKGNVEECMKLKSLPEYYNDSICKFGYARGIETINYVEHVIERWHYYREKVTE